MGLQGKTASLDAADDSFLLLFREHPSDDGPVPHVGLRHVIFVVPRHPFSVSEIELKYGLLVKPKRPIFGVANQQIICPLILRHFVGIGAIGGDCCHPLELPCASSIS